MCETKKNCQLCILHTKKKMNWLLMEASILILVKLFHIVQGTRKKARALYIVCLVVTLKSLIKRRCELNLWLSKKYIWFDSHNRGTDVKKKKKNRFAQNAAIYHTKPIGSFNYFSTWKINFSQCSWTTRFSRSEIENSWACHIKIFFTWKLNVLEKTYA